MTDINGVPIIEAPPEVLKPAVTIATVKVELARDQNIVEMKVRAPGIVRAAAFWLQTPTVLGASSMRKVEKVVQPLLFVECDPHGELIDKVFLFQPSDVPFVPTSAFTASYRASAIAEVGGLHVFEIVERPS